MMGAISRTTARHGGGVNDLHGRYGILLDRWRDAYPDHWPVTALFDSLESARRLGSHGGHNPSPVPKTAYGARRLEAIRLLDERTGRVEEGAIYRFDRADA